MSGLVNEAVLTREAAERVLVGAAIYSKDYAYLIIAGRSFPLVNGEDLLGLGFYPLLCTKWLAETFVPFYVCLTPRKTMIPPDGIEYAPVLEELRSERGRA